jgi:hypothetical protein
MAAPVASGDQCQDCCRYRLRPSICVAIAAEARTIPAFAAPNTRLRNSARLTTGVFARRLTTAKAAAAAATMIQQAVRSRRPSPGPAL